jgi:PhnB protein
MAGNVKPKPEGYHTLTPYLYFESGAKAIDWYKRVFGASERMRMPGDRPDSIGHAELEIGDSVLMLADRAEGSPGKLGATSVSFVLYVDDVDGAFKKAIGAGATEVQAVEDKFYGDRMGTLRDPFGHEWSIGTHIEDVSMEEMQRRAAEAARAMA